MKPRRLLPFTAAITCVLTASAHAGDVIKANNTTNLNLAGSWLSGTPIPPDSTSVAVWDSTVADYNVSSLGGSLSWQGIRIADVGGVPNPSSPTGGVQITGGSANILTLGTAGIAMPAIAPAATQALRIESSIALSGSQTWNIANANTSVNPFGTGAGHKGFDASLSEDLLFSAQAAATMNLGGFILDTSGEGTIGITSGYTLSNGTLNLANTNTWIQSGGSRTATLSSTLTVSVAANSNLRLKANSAPTAAGTAINSAAPISVSGTGSSLQLEHNNNTTSLTQSGNLTLGDGSTFQAIITGNGPFTVSGGIATGATSGTNSWLVSGVGNNANGIAVSGNLTGDGIITYENTATGANGQFRLSGNNSGFTGSIDINGASNNRSLRLNSATAGSAAATWSVAAANILQVNGFAVNLGTLNGAGTVTNSHASNVAALTVGSGTFSGAITNGTPALGMSLTKDTAGTLTLSGPNTYTGNTTVTGGTLVITTDDVLADTSTVTIPTSGSLSLTHTGTDVVEALFINGVAQLPGVYPFGTGSLEVPGAPKNLVWLGGGAAPVAWDINTTLNWQDEVPASAVYLNGDNVSFTDAGLSNSAVDVTVAVAPGSVTVNSTGAYSFSGAGSIGGSSSFSKSGIGTLEITTVNSYTGTTTINGGTLQVGSGAVAGSISSSSSIINDASLIFSSTEAQSYGNAISGTGTLTKAEAGILTLTGNSSYSGGTTISAGTVRIGHINSFGSGAVNIGSGATVSNSAALSGLANTFTGSGSFTTGTGQATITGNWSGFSGTVSSSAGTGRDMVFNGAFSSGVSVTTSEDAAYVNNYDVANTNGMIVQNLTGSPVTYKMGSYASAVGSNLRNSGSATGSVIFEIGKLGTDTTVAGRIGGGAQTTSLTKVGAGTLTLAGLNTYNGATTVTGGVLTITTDDVLHDSSTVTLAAASSLNLTHSGTDTVTGLIIGGIPQLNGLYTFGTGKLKVGISTPFEDWALGKGLDGTAGKENGPADDPDKDGSTNLAEFAFNGNPLSGSDNGQIYVLTADSDVDSPDTAKELILTLAVRKTTPAFTAGAPATALLTDGVNYSVHGSTDLASFGVTVTPIGFVAPGVALTDAVNYEYRSFSLNGSNGLAGKGFLRAKAEAP